MLQVLRVLRVLQVLRASPHQVDSFVDVDVVVTQRSGLLLLLLLHLLLLLSLIIQVHERFKELAFQPAA